MIRPAILATGFQLKVALPSRVWSDGDILLAGLLLVCYWAAGMLLVCCWFAASVLLVCCRNAPGWTNDHNAHLLPQCVSVRCLKGGEAG